MCLISDEGELIDRFAAPADRDGLYGLTGRVAVYDQPVRGVVESMNGARFVHDELVRHGWEVLIADAQRVKGLAPLVCKTTGSTRVLAELSLFMLRQDLPWLLLAHRAVAPAEPTDGCGREVLHARRGHGALYHSDLQTVMGRLPTEVERACGTA